MGRLFIIFFLASCVDQNGNPVEVQFYDSDGGDCLVSEHYKVNDVYYSICHLKNRSVYETDVPEKELEY